MTITHLELKTSHLSDLRFFYHRTLLLPIVQEGASSVTVRVGWSELTFRQSASAVRPYHFAINIPLYSLEQYSLWYRVPYLPVDATGNTIAQFPHWKARSSYFTDPAGNIVEFIERTDAGFADDYFQGISEIGLATNDVPAATRYCAALPGIDQFAKSQPQPDFNALGDDYGLLILAQTNRPWLFTNVPATASPCRVDFQTRTGRRGSLHSSSLANPDCVSVPA